MEQLKISINIIFVFQKLLIFNFRKYRFKKYQPSPLLTSTLIVSIFVFILLGFFFFFPSISVHQYTFKYLLNEDKILPDDCFWTLLFTL